MHIARAMLGVLSAAVLLVGSVAAQEVFAAKPAVAKAGGQVKIAFTLGAPTDVEVAILDKDGRVVRHLAAGLLGGAAAPPAPLKPGLAQELAWNGADDFGRKAEGGPFAVRVRAGTGVKLGLTIGDDPYAFGAINSIATDPAGRLFVMSHGGNTNQDFDTLRVFTAEGAYVRTLIPFPADLAPEAAAAFARWDEEAKALRPINRSNTNPAFVPWGTGARIVSASETGVVLTHGTNVYRLGLDGGGLQGPSPMWSKEAKLTNPGWNVPRLAVSPDGRYTYYSNVAGTKYDTQSPAEIDPRWPNGRVYRQEVRRESGTGDRQRDIKVPDTVSPDPQPFFDLTLPDFAVTKYWMPNAWNKRTAAGGLDVDKDGNLYVCDLVNQQVVVVSPDGKAVGSMKVPWPDRVHVNRSTGDLYVISSQPRDGSRPEKLLKVTGRGESARIAIEFPLRGRLGDASALGTVKGQPVLWLAGGDELVCLRDAGDRFEVQETAFKPGVNAQADFSRIAVDPLRDVVYTNDGVNRFWRYDGKTGRGEPLLKDGKPFHGVDLAVGYDGLLYVRTGTSYSGPLERYSTDLQPAPMSGTGTHVFTKNVYSRYGVGFCEKGVGVGPQGDVYVNFMYGWNQYLIAGFNGDGTPKKGLYLEGIYKPDVKSGVPADLTTAVVGPVPMVCGAVRVDLGGNLYVGVGNKPKGYTAPAAFAKDPAYGSFVGSIVKFGPAGGTFLGLKDAEAKQPAAPVIELTGNVKAENALAVYPGIAPFSGGGYGNNSSSCVCRVPRFDLDRYGRLAVPNAVSNSVLLYDNAGNLIVEFGRYGNFDSLHVNPNTEAGRAGKPTVAGPDLPLGWPVGAGWSETAVYVCDLYNRRVLRTDLTWRAQETCPVP